MGINKFKNDRIDDEETKALADFTLPEIAEMIEKKAEEYHTSTNQRERSKLKNEYIEMVEFYNNETGTKIFKKSL